MSYTKLFQSIVTSSIWTQDDHTRIVWITMLALANQHGEVQASIPGLARVSGVSVEAAEKAINHFLSPDAYSRTKDDDGRRIEAIDGGWALLNHAKYRAMASKEESKEASAVRQRRFRERAERNGSNGSVTPSNACVTPSNATVTPRRDIAEAEAEAEAEETRKEEEPSALVASLPVVLKASKEAIEFPSSLDTPEFRNAWTEWERHRRESRKPITPTSRKQQFSKLDALGPARAIAALQHSTACGYQGVFEPGNQATKPTGAMCQPHELKLKRLI